MDDEVKAISPSEAREGVGQNNPASPDDAALLIYTTFPTLDDAKKTGRFLVENRLAACINILPQIITIYEWEGKLQDDGETAMLVKTTTGRKVQVLDEIKRLHPYSVPARLVLPIAGGGTDFLAWIAAQCAPREPA